MSALFDKPPGRLGEEPNATGENDGWNDLERQWKAPGESTTTKGASISRPLLEALSVGSPVYPGKKKKKKLTATIIPSPIIHC